MRQSLKQVIVYKDAQIVALQERNVALMKALDGLHAKSGEQGVYEKLGRLALKVMEENV